MSISHDLLGLHVFLNHFWVWQFQIQVSSNFGLELKFQTLFPIKYYLYSACRMDLGPLTCNFLRGCYQCGFFVLFGLGLLPGLQNLMLLVLHSDLDFASIICLTRNWIWKSTFIQWDFNSDLDSNSLGTIIIFQVVQAPKIIGPQKLWTLFFGWYDLFDSLSLAHN